MTCRELLEALERICDKAHEYGVLPATIERLADHELRMARAFQGCDAEKLVKQMEMARVSVMAMDMKYGSMNAQLKAEVLAALSSPAQGGKE